MVSPALGWGFHGAVHEAQVEAFSVLSPSAAPPCQCSLPCSPAAQASALSRLLPTITAAVWLVSLRPSGPPRTACGSRWPPWSPLHIHTTFMVPLSPRVTWRHHQISGNPQKGCSPASGPGESRAPPCSTELRCGAAQGSAPEATCWEKKTQPKGNSEKWSKASEDLHSRAVPTELYGAVQLAPPARSCVTSVSSQACAGSPGSCTPVPQ